MLGFAFFSGIPYLAASILYYSGASEELASQLAPSYKRWFLGYQVGLMKSFAGFN